MMPAASSPATRACWNWLETARTHPASRSPRVPIQTRRRRAYDLLESGDRPARTSSPPQRNPRPSRQENLPGAGYSRPAQRLVPHPASHFPLQRLHHVAQLDQRLARSLPTSQRRQPHRSQILADRSGDSQPTGCGRRTDCDAPGSPRHGLAGAWICTGYR